MKISNSGSLRRRSVWWLRLRLLLGRESQFLDRADHLVSIVGLRYLVKIAFEETNGFFVVLQLSMTLSDIIEEDRICVVAISKNVRVQCLVKFIEPKMKCRCTRELSSRLSVVCVNGNCPKAQ